jgi:hypothetical protein
MRMGGLTLITGKRPDPPLGRVEGVRLTSWGHPLTGQDLP